MGLGQTIRTAVIAFRNLVLGGNIRSLSLLTKPRDLVAYVSENLFLFKTMNAKRGLPQRNTFEILPADDIESIRFGNLKSGTWFEERPSYGIDIVNLCAICRGIKPKTVFEIGTLKGYTAFHFALNTDDDTKIYTLDLPRGDQTAPQLNTTLTDQAHITSHEETPLHCFDGTDVGPKITCLYGDSATFDFSPYHRKVDFFFIDGAHSYEYVRSDTLNALECCHPGSVIAWHDFGRVGVNGVTKWLLEFAGQGHKLYAVPGGSLAFWQVQ